METTDVEKAFELLNKLDFEDGKFEITDALIEMAGWKKQQMIDKAAEWVEKYLFEIGYPDDWLRDSPNIRNGKTRFLQAMKGEQ